MCMTGLGMNPNTIIMLSVFEIFFAIALRMLIRTRVARFTLFVMKSFSSMPLIVLTWTRQSFFYEVFFAIALIMLIHTRVARFTLFVMKSYSRMLQHSFSGCSSLSWCASLVLMWTQIWKLGIFQKILWRSNSWASNIQLAMVNAGWILEEQVNVVKNHSLNQNFVSFLVVLSHNLANGDVCPKLYVKHFNSHIFKKIIWVAKSKLRKLITSTVSTLYLYSTLLRTKVLVVQPPSAFHCSLRDKCSVRGRICIQWNDPSTDESYF